MAKTKGGISHYKGRKRVLSDLLPGVGRRHNPPSKAGSGPSTYSPSNVGEVPNVAGAAKRFNPTKS